MPCRKTGTWPLVTISILKQNRNPKLKLPHYLPLPLNQWPFQSAPRSEWTKKYLDTPLSKQLEVEDLVKSGSILMPNTLELQQNFSGHIRMATLNFGSENVMLI